MNHSIVFINSLLKTQILYNIDRREKIDIVGFLPMSETSNPSIWQVILQVSLSEMQLLASFGKIEQDYLARSYMHLYDQIERDFSCRKIDLKFVLYSF